MFLIFFRPHETVTPVEDPVVREVSYVLKEWSTTWKQLYMVGASFKVDIAFAWKSAYTSGSIYK